MTIALDRAELLGLTHLAVGNHGSPEKGVCLLEAVAYVAGEPHSDHPTCAAGDAAGDAARDALQPTVELLQDSAIELFTQMVHTGRTNQKDQA